MAPPALDLAHCCRPCLRRLASQNRAFSTTPARRKHGPLETFTPTPSPELDTLLTKFRNNVFLPSHLITLQRDLVYRQKNIPLLTSDEPPKVRIGSEVITLQHLNRRVDEPATQSSTAKLIDLMSECGDWRNLPAFLKELKMSKRKLRTAHAEKMVRRLCEGGKQAVVSNVLMRVESTGVGLWEVGLARECMMGAVTRAVQSGWSEEGVEKAVQYAEGVWELIWDPRHTERGGKARERPEILGMLVLVHAAQGILFGKGKLEKMENYATDMLKRWGGVELTFKEGDWHDANLKLAMWAPVWKGVEMARQLLGKKSPVGRVLGEKLTSDLKPFVSRCRLMVEQNRPQEGKWRGLEMYEKMSQIPVNVGQNAE